MAQAGLILLNISQNVTNPINLYLNGTLAQNLTVIYPAQVNATAIAVYPNSGTLTILRNNSAVTNFQGSECGFTVAEADVVIIGFNVFNKVKDSQFSVIANYLRYADVTCNKDNNTALSENNNY